MMQLSQTCQNMYDLTKMYKSFFPLRVDQWTHTNDTELGAVGDFDPNDSKSTDFGPRIERFVHLLMEAE